MKRQPSTEAVQLDFDKLLRTVLHALRHDPWKYGLVPDAEGWILIDELVKGLREVRSNWRKLERHDIEVLATHASTRLELLGARLRARYGHSFTLATAPAVTIPPHVLFHGTEADLLDDVLLRVLGNRHV